MFFIVSTGRSGTKSIAGTLSQLEGIFSVHEPDPVLAIESSNYRYGKSSRADLINILTQTRQPIRENAIYCESNQALSLIIPVLIEAFPDARFVWLIRNGLDVVASAMQKQWYSGHSENFDRYENTPTRQQEWIKGRINGDECGEFTNEEWNSLSRFERCCWYWDYVNRIIESDLNAYVKREYFVIQLEKIHSQLPALINWMGLHVENLPQIRTTNPAKRPPYHWKKWSITEKRIFESRCGILMSKLYPEWQKSNGKWEGVKYELEPSRNKITFVKESLRRSIRNLTD